MNQPDKQTIYRKDKARPESQQMSKPDPKVFSNAGVKFNAEYQLNDSFPSLYYNTRFDDSSYANIEQRPSGQIRDQASYNI
jgi:hypothetical protein